jgi:hypothetical protein
LVAAVGTALLGGPQLPDITDLPGTSNKPTELREYPNMSEQAGNPFVIEEVDEDAAEPFGNIV